MTSIRDLKKNRANLFAKLTTEVTKIKNGGSTGDKQADDRYWQPTKDKVGNAVAVIRFLPALNDEEFPWVRTYSHGFQNKSNGSWYIEQCPTTINQKCPACEANSVLWNTGLEKNKTTVRERKRRLGYISNILVVSDPAHTENEGKVFLFRFGSKIFDKISAAMFPEFQDEKQMNPFDPWEGANFKLRVRKVEGYTNYDKSEFAEQTAISEDDAVIEAIVNKEHSLKEFVDTKTFKKYDELKTRLGRVLGEVQAAREDVADEDEDVVEADERPVVAAKAVKEVVEEDDEEPALKEDDDDVPAQEVKKSPVVKAAAIEDDDEMEKYLQKLAADDE